MNQLIDTLKAEVLARDAHKGLDYYRYTYLTNMSNLMRDARRQSGKTQEDVALEMRLEASTISKMENDTSGTKIKLSQFIDYLIACDKIPVSTVVDAERIRDAT